jgi:hypothetical protein
MNVLSSLRLFAEGFEETVEKSFQTLINWSLRKHSYSAELKVPYDQRSVKPTGFQFTLKKLNFLFTFHQMKLPITSFPTSMRAKISIKVKHNITFLEQIKIPRSSSHKCSQNAQKIPTEI